MKISDLPQASLPLSGAELVELSQSLTSRRATIAQIRGSGVPFQSPLYINSAVATPCIINFQTNGVTDGTISVLADGTMDFSNGNGSLVPAIHISNTGTSVGIVNGVLDMVARNIAQTQVRISFLDETYVGIKGSLVWDRATNDIILRRTSGATFTLLATGAKFDLPVGFNNTTPVAKPTITGSRGGNAALASLLAALAATGLLTDSTTA
jgi:hypothetical protein